MSASPIVFVGVVAGVCWAVLAKCFAADSGTRVQIDYAIGLQPPLTRVKQRRGPVLEKVCKSWGFPGPARR